MGWKRQYFRLLQDSLFSFKSHESKTPLDEVALMGGSVDDASWELKQANALRVETDRGQKVFLVCENALEHKQWFDALYYGTTVSTLAEYCSPCAPASPPNTTRFPARSCGRPRCGRRCRRPPVSRGERPRAIR